MAANYCSQSPPHILVHIPAEATKLFHGLVQISLIDAKIDLLLKRFRNDVIFWGEGQPKDDER